MARKVEMRLMELAVMQEDVRGVIEFLGRQENFEFQFHQGEGSGGVLSHKELFDKLQHARSYLGLDDLREYRDDSVFPSAEDVERAQAIVSSVDDLRRQERELKSAISTAVFSEQLSVSLGLAGSDAEVSGGDSAGSAEEGLAEAMELLKQQEQEYRAVKEAEVDEKINAGRKELIESYGKDLHRLLGRFSLGASIQQVESCLESTEFVYKIAGWVALVDVKKLTEELDSLTKGRLAICLYRPDEIPGIAEGREEIPVQFKHNKFVASFERMLFSYGTPRYGTIDVTPLMAFFYPFLFGIMFGDAGQGLVFLVVGILLSARVIKRFPAWNKFGPIFISLGCTSTIMGVLTGEFFANSEVLVPLSRYITGLYGHPHDHILHLMPSSDTIGTVFMFFGFTLLVGFIMNSIGLIINMINQVSLGHPAKALLGKNGLCGAVFFWYVIFMAIRVLVFKSSIFVGDWIVIGLSLAGAAFAHPIERLISGERPIFEDGLGSGVILCAVEVMEVVSGYMSNTVSFLRVGAFGLAHAVLGFIIFTMSQMAGGIGGLAIAIVGNLIVIFLEGMIVAIQVARLHYYEFFSKFFTETGREFKPFRFQYKDAG